ncbi:MAG: hypothetical protein MO853_11570 [Candidatus Protistobacter heckmanni]|nr:hypothetical protein [Candidatus Protistobacter heckmanni]
MAGEGVDGLDGLAQDGRQQQAGDGKILVMINGNGRYYPEKFDALQCLY